LAIIFVEDDKKIVVTVVVYFCGGCHKHVSWRVEWNIQGGCL